MLCRFGRILYGSLGVNGNNMSLDPEVNVLRVKVNGEAAEFAIRLMELVTHPVNAGDSIIFRTMPNIRRILVDTATVSFSWK